MKCGECLYYGYNSCARLGWKDNEREITNFGKLRRIVNNELILPEEDYDLSAVSDFQFIEEYDNTNEDVNNCYG